MFPHGKESLRFKMNKAKKETEERLLFIVKNN